jgi:antirestriction protein ArdC
MAESLDNHATYVKGWLKEMNDDPKFIFKAASQASKAVEFILSFSRSPETVVEPELDEVPF